MSEAHNVRSIESRLSGVRVFGPGDFALLDEACSKIKELKTREQELIKLVQEARSIIAAETLKRNLHSHWLSRAYVATDAVLYLRRMGCQ